MFSRYWRSYPWWLQLILFILMIFTLAYFIAALALVFIPKMSGIPAADFSTAVQNLTEKSPKKIIDTVVLFQAVSAIGAFVLPGLLFAYVMTPRPAQYLGLRKPGKSIHWLIVILLFLGAMPLFLSLGSLMNQIASPEIKAKAAQEEHIVNAFMQMDSLGDFFKIFFVLAIIPAFGEELIFRGILMRFAAKRTKNMALPMLISALMFMGMHGIYTGWPSIFLAGVLLAVIYYLTGSLWCSVLGHMLNNGLQIIILYFGKSNPAIKAVMDSNQLPAYIVVSGATLFIIALLLLIKYRTPLAANWTEDYYPGEVSENAA